MKTLKLINLCIITLILLTLLTTYINASLGTFKPNTCVNIRTILNSSTANINTINYPNSTLAISNKPMSKTGQSFNYTFCNTTTLGIYYYDYNDTEGNVYVNDFKIGFNITLVEILVYLFFLFLCIVITYFSIKLFKENKYSKSTLDASKMYEIKKRNEFLFYVELLKKKLWIVGVFGVYLSILIFFAILEQLVYSLGLTDISNILIYFVIGFTWGLIPFVLFWIVWLIFSIYKSTTDSLRYQFGGLKQR